MLIEYLKTTALLLRIAPFVFAGDKLALKGGTAINLFANDFPRLSVDIDCVFLNSNLKRDEALKAIEKEIERMYTALVSAGFSVKKMGHGDKINVSDGQNFVKVEVNTVIRGTILPIVFQKLCSSLRDVIPGGDYSVPVLNRDELYAGKLVAALDRQHPRDLFDVMHLFRHGGLTEQMLDCFAVYLASHNRPVHEVLAGHDLPIDAVFANGFVGMTDEPVSVEELKLIRVKLRKDIIDSLGDKRKSFLFSFNACEPDWSLLPFSNVADLPAIRWKMKNLQRLRKQNPVKFSAQLVALEQIF